MPQIIAFRLSTLKGTAKAPAVYSPRPCGTLTVRGTRTAFVTFVRYDAPLSFLHRTPPRRTDTYLHNIPPMLHSGKLHSIRAVQKIKCRHPLGSFRPALCSYAGDLHGPQQINLNKLIVVVSLGRPGPHQSSTA